MQIEKNILLKKSLSVKSNPAAKEVFANQGIYSNTQFAPDSACGKGTGMSKETFQ